MLFKLNHREPNQPMRDTLAVEFASKEDLAEAIRVMVDYLCHGDEKLQIHFCGELFIDPIDKMERMENKH